MRIAILSRNRNLYSTRRLVESGTRRGHQVRVLNPLKCYMNIASVEPGVHYKGERLAPFDAVIPRIGASVTFYGAAVLRQFEVMGSYPLNESVAVTRSRDKLRCLQILARAGIGLPPTGFASSPGGTTDLIGPDLIGLVGGAPLVVKLLQSSQGRGVVLAETDKAAESLIDAFRNLEANFLVQKFVAETEGADIRCFVLGDKVVAAMKRQAPAGEFRADVGRGVKTSMVKLTRQERSTATQAARRIGLNMAAVDLLRSDDGPLVIEVNSTPGLKDIESATGSDVGAMVIEFIEKNAQPHRTRTRGVG